MKKIKLTKNKYTIIDNDDFDRVSKYKWHTLEKTRTCYAVKSSIVNGKRKNIYLHRFLMNTPEGMETDHLNGNGLDNRKINLRVCTQLENLRNRPRIQLNNTSGYTGVSWNKKEKKWQTHVGKNKFIGNFTILKDAIEAVKNYKKQAWKHY